MRSDSERPGATAVSGIVLAGGRGTRLGGVNKALLDIGGQTTLERVLEALGDLVAETILVVNDESLVGTRDVRIVRDPDPHAGVLPAMLAALEVATGSLCVLVACDMPFLDRALLGWMVQTGLEHDVVIPRIGEQLQPMHAVYRREACCEAVAVALARGDRRMISFLDGLRVREIGEAELRRLDPELQSFFNINTAENLDRARGITTAGQPPAATSE